jgi:hypothetical protein
MWRDELRLLGISRSTAIITNCYEILVVSSPCKCNHASTLASITDGLDSSGMTFVMILQELLGGEGSVLSDRIMDKC